MDLLRVTGGRLGTDSYEFVHPVYIDGDHFDFDFHIAGWRHHGGDKHIKKLGNNVNLVFEKEPSNDKDPFAVMIKTEDGILLGYVPAFFSELMTRIIDEDCYYKVKVEKIYMEAIPQLRVNLIVNGQFNNYVEGNQTNSHDLIPVEFI